MFQTKGVEKLITHIMCSVTVFQQLCLHEMMWKNVVEPDRLQTAV